nr:hypothetical protein [Francisella tularensis]
MLGFSTCGVCWCCVLAAIASVHPYSTGVCHVGRLCPRIYTGSGYRTTD